MNQMIVSKVDENTVYPCYINFTNNALEHIAKLLGYRVQETPRNKQIEIVKTLLASQDTFLFTLKSKWAR